MGTAPRPVQGSAQERTGTLAPPDPGGNHPDENTVMGLSREGKGQVEVPEVPGCVQTTSPWRRGLVLGLSSH